MHNLIFSYLGCLKFFSHCVYFRVMFLCCISVLNFCVVFSCYIFVLYFSVIFSMLYKLRSDLSIACTPTYRLLVFVLGLHNLIFSCLGCLNLFSHCELFFCSDFIVLFYSLFVSALFVNNIPT